MIWNLYSHNLQRLKYKQNLWEQKKGLRQTSSSWYKNSVTKAIIKIKL